LNGQRKGDGWRPIASYHSPNGKDSSDASPSSRPACDPDGTGRPVVKACNRRHVEG
jgi:hypothetical protein